MLCGNCSHSIELESARYCPQCGKALHVDNGCLKCHALLLPGARFCHHCGTARSNDIDTADDSAERRQTGSAGPSRLYTRMDDLGIADSDWVEIPGGEFIMGSPESEKDRFDYEVQHPVTVGAFQMLKTPVTFEMFDFYCSYQDVKKPHDETWGRGQRPVINVSYWDVIAYCQWLKKASGWMVRLPTEAEWEYACRAGTTTPFWNGEQITSEQANFDGRFTYNGSSPGIKHSQTVPVAQFSPNPWGLFDMHGNVWEWCASEYSQHYNGLESENACLDVDNHNPRVVRGGSWDNVPSGLRSASRNKLKPDYHFLKVGFRLVRESAS